MATITKSIGTTGRDYSTVTLWEADLDDDLTYDAGDDAIGEMYADSNFNEAVILTGGSTIGLASIKLSVEVNERHDGTAGTGAAIVQSSSTYFMIENVGIPSTFEWFEVDNNGYGVGGNNNACLEIEGNTSHVLSYLILHDVVTPNDASAGILIGTVSSADVFRNIIYDIENQSTDAADVFGINTSTENVAGVYNNTVHNIVNNDGSGNATNINYGDFATTNIKNNIATSPGGTSSGTKSCYAPASPASAVVDYNLASDNTDSGANSIGADDGVVAANQFVSTTGGSEDLHLKSGADAIDAGVDLVTTPTGVNIDIDGRDINAEGDTWDIGADEFVAAPPSGWDLKGGLAMMGVGL